MTTSFDPQHEVPDSDREARDRRSRAEHHDVRDGEVNDPHRDRVDDRVDTPHPQYQQQPPAAQRDPVTQPVPVVPAPAVAQPGTAADAGLDRRTIVARQRALYGGIKTGSAFFGWLTAMGMAVLLTGLVAGIGVAVGLGADATAGDVADRVNGNVDTVSLAGAVLLMVIMFLSYYCGGYVAGRMARFNGAKQGFAVWLWALAVAIVVAVVAAVAGDRFDVLARLNSFPRLPVSEGDLPTAGIVTALALAGVSLLGAILGGMAGMRFHRKVDSTDLRPSDRSPDRVSDTQPTS